MRRAFASLYIIIVAAILVIGWGMDALWDAYNPEPRISEYENSLIHLLKNQFKDLDALGMGEKVDTLDRQLGIEINFYSLDDLSETNLSTAIVRGEPVLVRDRSGTTIIYFRLGDSESVLALKQQGERSDSKSLYFIFLLVFYLGLALVIYIWVWPLSRDLNRLEKQIKLVGKDGAAPLVELHRGSQVQALADAFNSMSIRIKELLQSQKEMTYAVSHELRTPLARMKFALEMASETENTQLLREQLLSVREDVNALDKFVNELLNYAGFDQSIQRLDMEDSDFLEFCNSIVSELEHEEIEIVVIAGPPECVVSCDWQLMERVLINLLQNALRYAHKKIQISFSVSEKQFTFVVEDDGPGIPDEDVEKVFQSFVRLENGARKTKGYGLGLAIVKRVIQWHQGSVKIERSILGGARFVVSWPFST